MAAPSGTPPPHRALRELVARLSAAGWAVDAEQLADALWLARRITPVGGPVGAEPGRPREAPGPAGEVERARPAGPPSERLPPDPGPGPAAQSVSLYAPVRHGGAPDASFSVHAPVAGALPGLSELQRALRPLQRYRSRVQGPPGPLDEDATADLSARSASVRPVFGPAAAGGTVMRLLMDASASASVWQRTFEDLRQCCERLGAFRDVQALHLHRGADGSPLIGTGPERSATRLRPADQYRDTTGGCVTLLLSDCVGPLWQEGAAQRLLHSWTGDSPLAVVQPLPTRLWPRTALPAEPGLLVRDRGTGGRVTFEPDEAGPEQGVPVPVLLPTPAAMGSWATLLGGSGRRSVRGAAAWVRPRHRAMPAPPPGLRDAGPRALLRAFRASASPGALELAIHLTAVPLVLPVIQLVQQAMLPDTGPMELAEVLLSGLLERLPDGDGEAGPRYAFLPGVHELLLRSLDQDTALLVLKHVSDFVTRRFGSGTRNFPALAVARLTGRPPSESTAPTSSGPGRGTGHHGAADELFAEVPARVLRWYTPEVTMSGPPRAEAERLLARWWSQGDPGVLRQAREHAEAAVAAAGGAPGGGADDDQRSLPDWQAAELRRSRRVLGQVLHALTRTGEVRRRPGRAAELLHEAARQLTAPDPETCFDRVPVLHDLWRAEQDASYLLTAERELRAMPAGAEGPAEGRRRLWLGRTLLALARSSGGTATGLDGRAAATASAAELEAAAGLLASTDGHAEDGTLCDVLLDLGAALRHCDAGAERQLATVRRAEAAAGEDEALRLRCARARARVHRDVGDWDAADEAYASAERLTGRDGERRCALLTEWGTMLMDGPWHPDRAEGVLREALTGAPAEGPLASRVSLLLGRALLLRYRSEHFLPDLYEGSHLLEQAARSAGEPALRAEAWLRLGVAEQEFPAGHVRPGRARTALSRSLEEARRARDAAPGTLAVARALHASGLLKQRSGATGAALADFRAAAAEWQRLSGLLHAVPFSEVAETRDRIAALETG